MKMDWMQQQQLSQLNEIREEMVSKEQSRRTDNAYLETDTAKELWFCIWIIKNDYNYKSLYILVFYLLLLLLKIII